MSSDSFPYIPPELVKHLEEIIPLRAPQRDDTHEYLMWYGGQRSVVETLKRVAKNQPPRNR